ncbi:TM2 domain-containing protein [Pseudarthrobacter sp. NamE5]|uniref:TM2 domain-containing protein n=1 Tax=Pseudarthrobacter sp. NamE5 TaxID=2576839 RepID=UPI001F0E47EF|nr:TM2 domain-containing protein [Pseudarthrobacter sp. NamE5]
MSQTPNLAPYPPANSYGQLQQSNKSFLVTWLLSLLLGVLGVDRFYLGKVGTGILKLVTLGGFGIWALIDLILILTNKMRDKQGLPLEGYDKHKKVALIVTAALILLSIIINVARGGSTPTSAPAVAPANDAAAPVAAAPAAPEPAAPAAEATWTKVAELTGSSDMASQAFALSGKSTRLVYSFTGAQQVNGQSMAVGAIYLEKEGVDITTDGGIPIKMLQKDESGETAVHKGAGNYYLDVKAANFDSWTITVEEKK